MHFDPSALCRPTREIVYEVARTHLPETLRLLRVPQQDVDDMVHAIVEIAYKTLDQYDPGNRDPLLALRGWLGTMAWHYVLTRRASGHRRFEVPSADVCEAAPALATEIVSDTGDASPELCVSREQQQRIVERILSGLRPERREVLVLHDALGFSAPEIAERLGIKEETVRSRWKRARRDFAAAANRLPPEERSLLKDGLLVLLWASYWPSSGARGGPSLATAARPASAAGRARPSVSPPA
jgi:RNA polymerase sigma factor (sigma-70 family)